jgi:hypothetical protein
MIIRNLSLCTFVSNGRNYNAERNDIGLFTDPVTLGNVRQELVGVNIPKINQFTCFNLFLFRFSQFHDVCCLPTNNWM